MYVKLLCTLWILYIFICLGRYHHYHFLPCVIVRIQHLFVIKIQPHILSCHSQKQQYCIILNFSTRLKGHNFFGREGVTVRKILGLGQTIKKLRKPLSALSCSAGALLCWHSSCLPVLFIALSFGGNYRENRTQISDGNLYLFSYWTPWERRKKSVRDVWMN